MSIASLTLAGFRSYRSEKSFHFSPQTTLVIGKNTAGKTNLLEALYVSQYGVSFRNSQFTELFHIEQQQLSLRIVDSSNTSFSIRSIKGPPLAKSFFCNDAKKTHAEYISRVSGAVLFEPADVFLASGPPDNRRKFLDAFLCVHDLAYAQAKIQFEKGLYKRNKLIVESKQYSPTFFRLLDQYDIFMIPHAHTIHTARDAFISYCNRNKDFAGVQFSAVYEKNPFTAENARWNRERDLAMRRTSFGPQRDDIVLRVKIGNLFFPVSSYGSRSEQRMAVLWLKRNELQYLEEQFGKHPLCLLDDVFSEFDHEHSKQIMQLTKGRQTILTTADKEMLSVVKESLESIINL